MKDKTEEVVELMKEKSVDIMMTASHSSFIEVPSTGLQVCVCVCVCVSVDRQGSLALAGSLSRRRKTLIQNLDSVKHG